MGTRVAVTGATGTVGRHVVVELLDQGVAVRALSRTASVVDSRAEAVTFSFTDPSTWNAAFAGADGLFLLRPPAIGHVRRDLLPAVDAARAAGVVRVAFLSVLGAERNPLLPHHTVERWLAGSGLRAAPIRAGNFMQNLTTVHAADVRDRDEVVAPAGHAPLSYVDARDVAAVAARSLTDERHAGRPWAPTGPRAITHDQIADVLTEVLGRTVRYTNPSLPGYWRHARRTGMPVATTVVTSVLYTLARVGVGARVTDDVERVLGRPATDFSRFARDHVDAWARRT